MILLVRPSIEYKESHINMLNELKNEDKYNKINVSKIRKNFSKYLFEINEREINPKQGRVPDTNFWLIVNEECVGTINIRHSLTENLKKIGGHIGYGIKPSERKKGYGTHMLKLALIECKKMGLNKVLITCSPNNIGSVKIIENNGGVLENEIIVEIDKENRRTLRYWIDI